MAGYALSLNSFKKTLRTFQRIPTDVVYDESLQRITVTLDNGDVVVVEYPDPELPYKITVTTSDNETNTYEVAPDNIVMYAIEQAAVKTRKNQFSAVVGVTAAHLIFTFKDANDVQTIINDVLSDKMIPAASDGTIDTKQESKLSDKIKEVTADNLTEDQKQMVELVNKHIKRSWYKRLSYVIYPRKWRTVVRLLAAAYKNHIRTFRYVSAATVIVLAVLAHNPWIIGIVTLNVIIYTLIVMSYE